MKRRIMFVAEGVGALMVCAGIAMWSIAGSLIVLGAFTIVACEVNQ